MTWEYIPSKGDIVWIDFNPQSGREQSGRRPALVLSSNAYNKKIGLVIVCPITTKIKGYPYEVKIPSEFEVKGVVLSDQIKSFDWKMRNTEFICSVTDILVEDVMGKFNTIIE